MNRIYCNNIECQLAKKCQRVQEKKEYNGKVVHNMPYLSSKGKWVCPMYFPKE